MTAKRLFCVSSAVLAALAAALVSQAQDAGKTNDAAIEELKLEKQAAAVAPAAAKADQAQPAKPPAAPAIEDMVPANAAEAQKAAPAAIEAAPAIPAEISAADALKKLDAPERSADAKRLADEEIVRRQVRLLEAQKSLGEADNAWKDKDYATALVGYNNANAKLPRTPELAADRARVLERLPQCERQVALALMKDGKNAEALARVKDASKRFPDDKSLKKMQTTLEREMAETVPLTNPQPPTGETQVASDVDRHMMEGRRAMAARDYAKARASFESVLAIDRDNREAMRYLKEIGDRQYNTATTERAATAAKMSASVRNTWNPPQYKMLAATVQTNVAAKTGEEPIIKKMERIIIPEIEFRQANIHDVVEFLNKASVEGDKQEQDPARRGINIILNLNPASGAPAAAAKAEGDIFAPEAPAAGGGGGAQSYEITFTARYITMLSAMKIITSVAGLRYRVDGNIVMIVPADYDPAQIEVRMYPVEPTFIQRVTEARSAMPATSTRTVGGREVTVMGGEEIAQAPADLKATFEAMGVRFPKGASITYNSAIGKVIVGNTAENLAVFEKLLAELNVVPKQVEIEARFVEVNETDLQELGLEWLLNDDWELATKNTGAYTPLAAAQRVVVNKNSSSGGFTKGLRFWGTDSSSAENAMDGGSGTKGSLLSVSSVLTNPELSLVLHALEQNGNADLLSAPKVTTRSGSEASIRVVTEYIYPTSFNVEGGAFNTSSSATTTTIQETVVTPEDFQTREVGVILTVLPEVSPDGNMINLTMTPSVVTEPTWYQYGSTVRRADGSEQQLNMPQPFFHMRTINTQISIYDGATVVMGGLITEDLRKVNDKIPVLGDIPLIGFLFRSQSEKSIKKNLMIFVTAKLVDPAGKPIRDTEGEKATVATTPAVGGAVAPIAPN